MRHVDVVLRREDVRREALVSRACVVIDVLRAGTTVARALANGAREVRPFREVHTAQQECRRFGPGGLLAGERGGLRPAGFELGNSPLEFTPERVAGKTIFLTTTNGAAALADCAEAPFVLMAALVNVSAVARVMVRRQEDVLIVASGTEGFYSAEDTLCAGIIVEKILKELSSGVILGDGATIAAGYAKTVGARILEALLESSHGRRLVSLGFKEDVKACSEVDALEVVPVLDGKSAKLVRLDFRNGPMA